MSLHATISDQGRSYDGTFGMRIPGRSDLASDRYDLHEANDCRPIGSAQGLAEVMMRTLREKFGVNDAQRTSIEQIWVELRDYPAQDRGLVSGSLCETYEPLSRLEMEEVAMHLHRRIRDYLEWPE